MFNSRWFRGGSVLIVLIGVMFPLLGGISGAHAAPLTPEVEPALVEAMAADEVGPLQIIVTFRSVGEVRPPEVSVSPLQARKQLVNSMQRSLRLAAAPMEPALMAARARGDLLARQDLWIINGMALTVRPDFLKTLMNSPYLATIREDHYRNYLIPQPTYLPSLALGRWPAGREVRSLAVAENNGSKGDPTWGVQQIRTPEVWSTLAVSGTGAVVAVVDTGGDWLHPALQDNYRGNLGHGVIHHAGSWYDAVAHSTYPYDDHGHGTHVLGSAVGAEGIGVAPGARWIAVKVLNGDGNAAESWIHAGFQWLLAPEGDPALAPDIVNCSWGSADGSATAFQPDLAVLLTAGILPVTAAGNDGPGAGTVRSPASLPGILAVGASDSDDETARFSSRGPSAWGEIKPQVAAPGVQVLSAYPGGTYQSWDGTSMAAPHVSGLAALMRSISSTVLPTTMVRLITQTVVPLSPIVPNNDSGWGRVDAFAALSALMQPGQVVGTVSSGNGEIIAGARVEALPHAGHGHPGTTVVGADGSYRLTLSEGIYDITVSAFGYYDQIQSGISVSMGMTQTQPFTLWLLPQGQLSGKATVLGGQTVPTRPVGIQVEGTPVTTSLDVSGRYTLTLPAGVYTIEARGLGYHVATQMITLQVNDDLTWNPVLTPEPTLLLVDDGAWHYGSQIQYWQKTLDELGYVYDTLRVKHVGTDIPLSTTLKTYDIVFWSSPQASPALAGGGDALEGYLKLGGRLFLSGQNIAYFDGGGFIWGQPQPYFTHMLGAFYQKDTSNYRNLQGLGATAGFSVTISGGDGADNQNSPDEVTVTPQTAGQPLWQYPDGEYGGVSAAICTPYRALFSGFGFEAISNPADRQAVMARSLEWLISAPLTHGLTLYADPKPLVGTAGTVLSHTLYLKNIGQAGMPATIQIETLGNRWPTRVLPAQTVLSPCHTFTVTVLVTVPTAVKINETDVVTLVFHSNLADDVVTTTLYSKTPAPVLLVDDDRWYPMEERYEAALQAAGVSYDLWDTRHMVAGVGDSGSVTSETLRLYPMVVWFTGYDWIDPVTAAESGRLFDYLEHDGRLLLTSQDFTYYHDRDPLALRLGILRWNEALTPTTAVGVPEHPASGTWGPVPLGYPFQNFSDVIEPNPKARVVARGQFGQPSGIAAVGMVGRSLFYGFPLETLPAESLSLVLQRNLGWLSPLGLSRWQLSSSLPVQGERITATLLLHNDNQSALPVTATYPLLSELAVDQSSIPAGMVYDVGAGTLSWAGVVSAGQSLTFTWGMTVVGGGGVKFTPTVTLAMSSWNMEFYREVPVVIGGSRPVTGRWLPPEGGSFALNSQVISLTFYLQNPGPVTAEGTLNAWLMAGITPLTATRPSTIGEELLFWVGTLASGEELSFTLPFRFWGRDPVRVDALWEDHLTGRREEWSSWVQPNLPRIYLPIVMRGQ